MRETLERTSSARAFGYWQVQEWD